MIKKEHSQLIVLLYVAVNISIHFAIFALYLEHITIFRLLELFIFSRSKIRIRVEYNFQKYLS